MGVAWVPFLLDGDISAVADLSEQLVQSRIVDPTATDRAHDALSAGVEEPDVAPHDIDVFRVVDVLEVNVVGAGGVAPEGRDWVHTGVVHMSGVETEPGDFFRDVLCDAIELILELDVAAGVRVDNRTDAMAVARQFRDGADVGDHAVPSFWVEARGTVGMAGGVVPL